MQTKKARILLVEDDINLSVVLSDYLKLIGYQVVLCQDGKKGLEEFKKEDFDLCILDVMIPKMDGFTLATHIRDLNPVVPLIFLTAKSLEADRLKGFQIGCDDYITKPFSTEELKLRIRAILKRCMISKDSEALSVGGIFRLGTFSFDPLNMTLRSKDGETTRLTRKESALLKVLCENKNRLLPRETALTKVWGDNDYFVGRSMDVYIARLRKYLKADASISITNVHGAGFKLEIPE